MAISNNSIIRITDFQRFDGQQCLNVYYYEVDVSLIAPSAATVAQEWWDDVKDVIRNLQTEAVTHIRIAVQELDGTEDYGEYIVPVAEQEGLHVPTTPDSAFDAYGVAFYPINHQVRPGGKRIVGVDEFYIGSYGSVNSDMLGFLDDYGAHMISQLNLLPSTTVLTPKIVGFPNPNRVARVAVDMQGYVVNPYKTTQNTRKRGRGI